MSKDLIIVESPAKVRTIKKFLGKDYFVEASVGHVRDLPTNALGVDEAKDFEPQYQVIEGKQAVVSRLKSAAKSAGVVYLAPDPDREGEAIAWHVAELIKEHNTNIKRIQFNEITANAVREALEHPRVLDEKLFDSQQARRILDRLVGYKISPLLWSKVKRGISAGRVQSVALKIIAERERERQAFVPEEYWVFKARLEGAAPPPFVAELNKYQGKKAEIGSAAEAEALDAHLSGKEFVVSEVKEKERSRTPPPPFITSTMQQAASQRLGYSAKKTMGTAQRLYEGVDLADRGTIALITYMRTDSVRIADEARDAARAFIEKTFGKDYYPPKARVFKTKAGAQDAHEAVRPVDVSITPDSLQGLLPKDQYHLYRLIWERFVASQMAAARFWDTVVTVAAGETLWRAKGERLLFPGFLAVLKGGGEQDETSLPKLTPGETLRCLDIQKEQKFTQPPPRYSEASLIRELEEKGIGRPSTYASIISTLLDRDYTRLEEKHFVPTELGYIVTDLLAEHFPALMDVDFTAGMERLLDSVAEGSENWIQLLKRFTGDFYPALHKAQQEMSSIKGGVETGLSCEDCGKPLVIKFGKAGQFLACSGYPDCKNTKDFVRDEKGTIVVVQRETQAQQIVGRCPDCGKDLALKRSRTGSRFIACTGYPACRFTQPFGTGVACPVDGCGGELVEKSSRKGKVFYSCNQYPRCDYASWDWPVQGPCPDCGFPILVRKNTKARGEYLACPQKSCGFNRELEDGEAEAQEALALQAAQSAARTATPSAAKAPATKTTAKKTATRKTAAAAPTATDETPAPKAAAQKAPAKKAPANKAPAKKAPAKKAPPVQSAEQPSAAQDNELPPWEQPQAEAVATASAPKKSATPRKTAAKPAVAKAPAKASAKAPSKTTTKAAEAEDAPPWEEPAPLKAPRKRAAAAEPAPDAPDVTEVKQPAARKPAAKTAAAKKTSAAKPAAKATAAKKTDKA